MKVCPVKDGGEILVNFLRMASLNSCEVFTMLSFEVVKIKERVAFFEAIKEFQQESET